MTTENFEMASIQVFEVATPYKTTKYSKHSFSLIKRGDKATDSGFLEAARDGVGNKELVVGDDSTVRIDFGMKIKNLSWLYYTTIDYTTDDYVAEFGTNPDSELSLSTLTTENFDDVVYFDVINGGTKVSYSGGAPGTLTSENLGDIEMDAIEIRTTLAGALHFDRIQWDPA